MSTIGSGVLTSLDGGILRITIDCAASMNAVLTETLDAIAEAFETYSMDPDVRVAVLTGAGRSFCTGGSEPAGSSCSARETSPRASTRSATSDRRTSATTDPESTSRAKSDSPVGRPRR
ncbi:enoyl-CoA hydratase-related protein [Rhodococcus sp. TAF43]|uniref:enoyl-CoA hydratase-related protein n=1 Tax=Rhodococcus sp. TAF43 TaxID=3237483 RepID=UPI003F9AF71A